MYGYRCVPDLRALAGRWLRLGYMIVDYEYASMALVTFPPDGTPTFN